MKRTSLMLAALLFVLGIVFRWYLVRQNPQPFGWDQYEYHQYATKMMNQSYLASHSYRSYPYPLFLAVVYRMFGFANFDAVRGIQMIMDAATGLLLFMVLRYALRSAVPAWIAFAVYEANPFTAGYTGVLLSEVFTAFTIATLFVFGVLGINRPRWWWIVLTGFFASLAGQIRNSSLVWAAIPAVLLLFFIPLHQRVRTALLLIVGAVIPLLYPLFVNWRDFRELSITTVDSTLARELFNGAILRRLPPFTYAYPPQVQQMYGEYYSEYDPGRTTGARRAMAKKYYAKTRAIIAADPWSYLWNRTEKMWYVWQKENIFFYEERDFQSHRMITFFINAALLLMASVGLLIAKARRLIDSGKWMVNTIIISLVSATIFFSFTHAEYRLTIPFYPMLILAAAMSFSAYEK